VGVRFFFLSVPLEKRPTSAHTAAAGASGKGPRPRPQTASRQPQCGCGKRPSPNSGLGQGGRYIYNVFLFFVCFVFSGRYVSLFFCGACRKQKTGQPERRKSKSLWPVARSPPAPRISIEPPAAAAAGERTNPRGGGDWGFGAGLHCFWGFKKK
jgi:hypothetical protein